MYRTKGTDGTVSRVVCMVCRDIPETLKGAISEELPLLCTFVYFVSSRGMLACISFYPLYRIKGKHP